MGAAAARGLRRQLRDGGALTTAFDADVLVVGGGPVGLSLALELGLRGNAVLLVERDPSRGPQPRAKTLNMRSLEHFRRWGVAEAVRAAAPNPDLPTDVVFQTRLYGKHLVTVPNIYFRGNTHADDPRFSEPSEWIPQYLVERILQATAATLGNVTLRYGIALVELEQDEDGVSAQLDGQDGTTSVRARYVVGADGARSRTRELIGATMAGRHAFALNYNMMLEIPELNADPPSPRGIMHWTINPDSPGVLGPIGDQWYAGAKLPPGATTMTDAEIHDFITGTIGREVDFRVVAVDPWYAHQLIADRYRDRRIFLAGDACHLHPPFGGYGMNMGIADAVDLGWKLDAMLHGWAGDTLLDSYTWERRRVHQWTIDEAVANYALLSPELVRDGMEDDTPEGEAIRATLATELVEQKRREFVTIGLVLGYHYGGSPVVIGGEDLLPPSTEDYVPVAAPGVLAPHLWLSPGVSLYDRFGAGFTLIDRGGATAAFSEAAAALGVPLTVLPLDAANTAALYPAALTLVRPDQHIAWMGDAADAATATAVLRTVTGR